MSLINDVLRDLEARSNADSRATLGDLRAVRRLSRRRHGGWLALAAVALVGSSAFALLDSTERNAAAPLQVPDAVAAIPATVTAEPAPDEPTVPEITVRRDARYASLMDFSRSLQARPTVVDAAKPGTTAPPRAEQPDDAPDVEATPLHNDATEPTRAAAAAAESAPAVVRASATDGPQALREAARAAVARGDVDAAQAAYRELTAESPHATDGWLQSARLLATTGRHDEAEQVLSAGLRHAEDPAVLARDLARYLLARDATAESLKLLEAYRPRRTLDAEHDAFIAAVQQRLGNHAAAAERYRAVLAVQPENAAWWVGLAISEEGRGRRADALEAYRHARNLGNLDGRLDAYATQRIAAMQGTESS